MKQMELLAPAGDLEILKIAVRNGADSVYFGTSQLNARSKARNIPPEEMEEAIDYAHLHGVRTYLALNTLILDREVEQAEEIAVLAARLGIDAVIIQDLGLADRLKQKLPDLPLHASTQATIYDTFAVDACKHIGISRIILPRELSLEDIKAMSVHATEIGIETEVFVHGAQCVCYSGQCLLSSMIGGRSGNRGACAQPCRLLFERIGSGRILPGRVSALSARDISTADWLEELSEAGVSALKIEGRMRSAEYVGTVTHVFRRALDGFGIDHNALLLSFNRGGSFSDHMLRDRKGQESMTGLYTGSYGVLIGEVAAAYGHLGVIELIPQPQATQKTDFHPPDLPGKGDVLSVRRTYSDTSEKEIISAPIGSAELVSGRIRIKGFHPDAISKAQIGDKVFRMNDAALIKETMTRQPPKIPLKAFLHGQNDTLCLTLEVMSGISRDTRYTACIPSAWTPTQPDQARIRCLRQLSKTGASPFRIEDLQMDISPFVPVSVFNELRREALNGLSTAVISRYKRPEISLSCTEFDYSQMRDLVEQDHSMNHHLLSAAFYRWDGKADSVSCGADYYELPAVAFFNEEAYKGIVELRGSNPDSMILVWIPPAATGSSFLRIRDAIDKLIRLDAIDGILSGNPGAPFLAKKLGICAFQDFSANITNAMTAAVLKRFGAASIALSPELSLHSNLDLISHLENANVSHGADFDASNPLIEIAAYGRLRLMSSEHCPIGSNREGCRICVDKEQAFSLRDPTGATFPVVCHPEFCTADLLNSDILCVPQELYEISCRMRAGTAGKLCARLIFTQETPGQQKELISRFRELLSGQINRSQSDSLIDAIREAAGKIARDRHCKITRGHFHRGI